MKKRLFLVNYEFRTGGHRYNDYELVTIKFDKKLDEEAGRKAAEKTAERWFRERGTDAELISVVAKPAHELIYWPGEKAVVTGSVVSHPGIEIPFGNFSSDQNPFVDPATAGEPDGETSDLVLIDLDGKQENYVTGVYRFPYTLDGHHTDGYWSVDAFYQESLDLKKMRWSYLDLARYKKK